MPSFDDTLQEKYLDSPVMQLAFTVLGDTRAIIIAHVLPIISESSCNVVEVRYLYLNHSNVGCFLVEGNWNQIAKLENLLENLSKKSTLKIHSFRQEEEENFDSYMPYSLEAITTDHPNLLNNICEFLFQHHILVTELTGSKYQTAYVQTPVFAAKFTILIPANVRLLSLREEFLDFCDQLNIDAILEPIKR